NIGLAVRSPEQHHLAIATRRTRDHWLTWRPGRRQRNWWRGEAQLAGVVCGVEISGAVEVTIGNHAVERIRERSQRWRRKWVARVADLKTIRIVRTTMVCVARVIRIERRCRNLREG